MIVWPEMSPCSFCTLFCLKIEQNVKRQSFFFNRAVHIVQIKQGKMSFPAAVFVWFRKTLFDLQKMNIFSSRCSKESLRICGNAPRTAVSFVKLPSGFFKECMVFIYQRIWCLALWLKCYNNIWEAQTGSRTCFNSSGSLNVLQGTQWVPEDTERSLPNRMGKLYFHQYQINPCKRRQRITLLWSKFELLQTCSEVLSHIWR